MRKAPIAAKNMKDAIIVSRACAKFMAGESAALIIGINVMRITNIRMIISFFMIITLFTHGIKNLWQYIKYTGKKIQKYCSLQAQQQETRCRTTLSPTMITERAQRVNAFIYVRLTSLSAIV